MGVVAYLYYRKNKTSQAGGDTSSDGTASNTDATDQPTDQSFLDKVKSAIGLEEDTVGYQFPNGFADLDNWKDADDGSSTFENRLTKFMVGVGMAEGYNVPGSIPNRANNPGDLTSSLGFSETGQTLGEAKVVVFIDRDNGWAALEHQLRLAIAGKSHVYSPSMTIQDFANKYTATQPEEWASNVANSSGFPKDQPLNQIFA